MQGSAGFCSLDAIFHDLEHPTVANLWQSCHILVLLSTSFSVFLFCPFFFMEKLSLFFCFFLWMNISYFCFILFNLEILGEIVNPME